MDPSIYRELQAAAERAYPFVDGPAWQTLSRMEDDLDALLPPFWLLFAWSIASSRLFTA